MMRLVVVIFALAGFCLNSTGAFVVSRLGFEAPDAARKLIQFRGTHALHGHGSKGIPVAASSVASEQLGYGSVVLVSSFLGFAFSMRRVKEYSRRTCRKKLRLGSSRDVKSASLAARQAGAPLGTAGRLVPNDIDSVETAMAEFVPKIALLQTQAQTLRSAELSDVISAMQDLNKPELQNVFVEADSVLSGLVDAIQNLKAQVIKIRRSEIQQQVEQMDRGQASVSGMGDTAFGMPAVGQDEIDTMMEVHVVGLSHHSAPVEIRELLAVPRPEWNSYAQELVNFTHTPNGHVVPEVAVLSTCNRFEIYFSSRELSQYSAIQCVYAFLRHKSGLSRDELDPYLFTHTGANAVHHLFEVASGLDSLVLGEAQILGQVKACHENCIVKPDPHDDTVVPGSGGKIIARMLNSGIRMGKLARTRTQIGVGAVSVSSAAVELVMARSLGDVRKYPENLHVCIVGAGKMSRLLLLALFSKYPEIRLTLVNRSVENARALLEEVAPRGGRNAVVAHADEMLDVIRQSDVVITATGSSTPIIKAADLEGMDRNLMLIDIAVPRNIASECDQVDGVKSYTVDDLKKIQEANNKARESEVLKAKSIIEEQAHNFRLWQQSQGAVPYLAALQEMAENVRVAQTARASKKLKDLHAKEKEAVDDLSRSIISQLFRPIYYAMQDEEQMSSKKTKILGLKKIFGLEPYYKRNRQLFSGIEAKQLAAVDA
jgi:glutamyl-tRNA reductase